MLEKTWMKAESESDTDKIRISETMSMSMNDYQTLRKNNHY
jgi:hypothetical protein